MDLDDPLFGPGEALESVQTTQPAQNLASIDEEVAGRSDQQSPAVPLANDVAKNAFGMSPPSSLPPDPATVNTNNAQDSISGDSGKSNEIDGDFVDIEHLLSSTGKHVRQAGKDAPGQTDSGSEDERDISGLPSVHCQPPTLGILENPCLKAGTCKGVLTLILYSQRPHWERTDRAIIIPENSIASSESDTDGDCGDYGSEDGNVQGVDEGMP